MLLIRNVSFIISIFLMYFISQKQISIHWLSFILIALFPYAISGLLMITIDMVFINKNEQRILQIKQRILEKTNVLNFMILPIACLILCTLGFNFGTLIYQILFSMYFAVISCFFIKMLNIMSK